MATTSSARRGNGALRRYGDLLRSRFIAGLIILAPFLITYFIFRWLYNLSRDLFAPLFGDWFGLHVPGLGLVIVLLVPLVVGVIGVFFAGRRVIYGIQATVSRIPVVGPVFMVADKLIESFTPSTETGFNRVVEIQYPGPGLWTLGFLTSIVDRGDGQKAGLVYVPTAPTPQSGWLAIIPIENIREVSISPAQTMKLVLSAGVAAPSAIIAGQPVSLPATTP